ncbi:MAG: pitrilysin family protein [Minisyncoccia bacterium]
MYKKSKLSNGVTVITVPLKATKTVTVLVLIKTGSKNEVDKNRGVSHFLEHMFFKGTGKRPTSLDLSKTLDSVGGVYNAFTGKEYTGFWTKVDADHTDLALDVISDMLICSKFLQAEIDKERGTIIEEMNMYLDNPIMYVPTLFENLLYSGQPLGNDEIGTRKTIASVMRKDFVDYYRKYYNGENIVVAVAGSFNEMNIKSSISKYFKPLNKRGSGKQADGYDEQKKPGILINDRKTDQTHICLGVRGYNMDHKDRYAINLLSIILGGNMSSRLFISVRERLGLAYYISTSAESYKHVGYFVTQAGVSNEKCKLAIEIILREYKKFTTETIGDEELKKAKDYWKGRSMIALESSDSMANFVAMQELYSGKILTPEERFAKIDKVTAADIKRVASDIFTEDKLNLAAIGPIKDEREIMNILNFN